MNDVLITSFLSLLCLGCSPFNVEAQRPLANIPAPQSFEVASAQSVAPAARQAITPSTNTAITHSPLYADGGSADGGSANGGSAEANQYSGEIGTIEGDRTFSEFLFANDGQWVNLNVYINENSENYGEDWIALCAEATLEGNCTAVSINYEKSDVEALFLGETDGLRTLRGHWQVRVNPGMYQGFLSVSLLAIP